MPDAQIDLPDIQDKRDRANQEAERHRHHRDKLNDKTRSWADRRDELNAKVRELLDQAAQHRTKRDEMNDAVKEAKRERDARNKRVNELLSQVNRLKREKSPRGVIPLGKLRREMKALEFRQQTTVLSVEKERDLVESLTKIRDQIEERERELEKDEEVKAALEEVGEAREAAETAHHQVGELAEQAQKEHDAMMALYEQSDAIRAEADQAQEEFIRTKMMADEEHKRHIDFIREVHDYDKILWGFKQKTRTGRIPGVERTARAEAEDIYERFKRGEKLSTEDLMTLQKAGLLGGPG